VAQYDAGDTETQVEERCGGQKELCRGTPNGKSKLQQTTERSFIRLHFLTGGGGGGFFFFFFLLIFWVLAFAVFGVSKH